MQVPDSLVLLLAGVSSVCLYCSLKQLYGSRLGRVAVVPVVTTFARMTDTDFVHYTSEHVPVAILSIAPFLVARLATLNASTGNKRLMLIGLLLGAAPYAKLQATPIAAAVGCICLHVAWRGSGTLRETLKAAAALAGGCVSFSVFHLALVAAYSLQELFWRSYVVQNIYYSNFSDGVGTKLVTLLHLLKQGRDCWAVFGLTFVVVTLGLPALVVCEKTRGQRRRAIRRCAFRETHIRNRSLRSRSARGGDLCGGLPGAHFCITHFS